MALFLATGYLQSSSAIKKPEFLASIQTSSSMARNKPVFLASSRCLLTKPRLRARSACFVHYAPPTNPKVATLMRTETGRTARRARKQL